MKTNKSEINKANRKAISKFLPIAVLCAFVGGVSGYLSGKYSLNDLSDSVKSIGVLFSRHIAPWLMLVTAIIIPAVCIILFKQAKKLLNAWDGENEEIYDLIDLKLSVIMWISSFASIVAFFLISASYSGGFSMFDNNDKVKLFFIALVSFFAVIFEVVVIQQKAVDMTKMINPEKKASIYDLRFNKKWLDTCDEAEKLLIGKCAFKAHNATNIICTVLALLFALGALVLDFGFLPSLAVCIIWIVNQSAYCIEAIKYSKKGKKIS